MRIPFLRGVLLLFMFITFFSVQAQTDFYTVETVPNPKSLGNGYVSNPDNIISGDAVAQLNRLISEIEDSTDAQLAVVILQSIGQANPKEFTTRLFNAWGIGQADVDNGLLIFAVMDQRRTEFETGYGLEGVLPDVVCYRIAMQQLVPEFKVGRYGEGLIKAVEEIKFNLENPEAAKEIASKSRTNSNRFVKSSFSDKESFWLVIGIYGGIASVICLILLSYIMAVLRSREELYDKYLQLNKTHWIVPLIFFPIPYIFLYLYIRRKLKSLRYQKRYARESGEPLRMLSEQEEDEYLVKGQITEEEIGSVDYDVWVTESGTEMLILRYKKRWTKYKACPKCKYITYYRAYTKTLVSATYSSSGVQLVVHKCKSCTYKKEERQTIPQKVRSSGGGSGGSFSSGGGSSFGGGSSGGGGAGASW